MKKVIKILLGILCGAIILSFGGCAILIVITNERNENYYKYATPFGEIEKKYTKFGDYEVSYKEYDANNDTYKKFEIWYPTLLETENTKFPLVIITNGTGIKASSYKTVFKHLASWGFVVAGNEDENTRTGESSSLTLDYLISLSNDSSSIFYNRIDIEKIGIAGHSQGGVGAINAVTNYENGRMYKAIFTASTTSKYHANELNKESDGWSINLSNLDIPIFMTAGTGLWDAGNVEEFTKDILQDGEVQGICPLWWLDECFDTIPNSVTKVIARMAEKDHGDMLKGADAYMTAWFIYYLKDELNADFFNGNDAEITTNPNYQDVKVN